MEIISFDKLTGEEIIEIEGLSRGSELVRIRVKGGASFLLKHNQDCCESVYVADFHVYKGYEGKVKKAWAETNKTEEPEDNDGYYTWTYYMIETDEGNLTIRWFGGSNGFYSEEVDCYRE